jgi:hypothetical protein
VGNTFGNRNYSKLYRRKLMSADNGIYIAKFKDGYRVTHAQAIENVDYYKVGTKEYLETLKDYF